MARYRVLAVLLIGVAALLGATLPVNAGRTNVTVFAPDTPFYSELAAYAVNVGPTVTVGSGTYATVARATCDGTWTHPLLGEQDGVLYRRWDTQLTVLSPDGGGQPQIEARFFLYDYPNWVSWEQAESCRVDFGYLRNGLFRSIGGDAFAVLPGFS